MTPKTTYKLTDTIMFRLIFGTVAALGMVVGGGLISEKLLRKPESKTSQNEQVACANSDVIFNGGFDATPIKCPVYTTKLEERVFTASFESASAPKAKTCEDPDVIFSGGFSETLPKCKVAPKP